MSEEIKCGRGRHKKNINTEIKNTQPSPVQESNNENIINETNSYQSYYSKIVFNDLDDIFGCSITTAFTPEEIKCILKDPIQNHSLARKLAMFVYNTEGVVTNAIDYMTALPCLDRVVYAKKRIFSKFKFAQSKVIKNKDLMTSTLENINDKQFIRDALFTAMNEGAVFYYFDTTSKIKDNTKFMRDWDVENIIEICDLGLNAVMVPLPYEYCKIVGRKNGRYVIAFNLRYFDEAITLEEKSRKLKKYPKEIRDGYYVWERGNKESSNWLVLDNDHTIAFKIKSKISEPWGRPLAIAAIADILYEDEFVDTKRNILRELNNKIIYQTLPEGRDKGSCALTKKQQEDQHDKVKTAVLQKNNRGGTSFFTVAAGTKINALDVSTDDIFDSKNESDLTDKIALDLGIAASLLNGSGSGNYSSQQNNLELINAQIYSWIQELQNELNYIINTCIIKDKKNKVEVYYLPTSLVNRKNFFEMMKDLYLTAGGSLSMFIAATGLNPEVYFALLDEEIENKIFDTYKPHLTSYTQSNKNGSGRPEKSDPTNESTIQTKANNSNGQPKPSTS